MSYIESLNKEIVSVWDVDVEEKTLADDWDSAEEKAKTNEVAKAIEEAVAEAIEIRGEGN